MRTTVTLDPDVEKLLREAQHRMRTTFKETLNQAIRRGLRGAAGEQEPRFEIPARFMGLRPEIDPAELNDLEDEIEIDAFLSNAQDMIKKARSGGAPKS